MPLRAIAGERSVNAFDCDESEWADLKKNYKSLGLVMPCCSSLAIPKTSKLGNYFFSHVLCGNCDSAPESTEHIYLKTLIAKAAISAGWAVVTEWQGFSSEGEKWVADVFCERGSAKIALEVQLSYQTAETLEARQEIYRKSGVRAAWFASSAKFKNGYLEPSKEIPFFRVQPFEVGGIPAMSAFNVTISEFVVALLSKRVVWKFEPWIYLIHYVNDICWKCQNAVKQVFGYSIDVYSESAKTVPNMSTVLEGLSDFITNDELKSLGLNTVGRFEKLKGNAPGFPCCNQCIYCGAPQNNYYVMKKIEEVMDLDDEFNTESPAIGTQEYASPREGSGFWSHEK